MSAADIFAMVLDPRMAVLNLAVIGSMVEILLRREFQPSLLIALWVIAIGSTFTCGCRLRRIVQHVNSAQG